jgi:SsrA-binding protein
VAENRKSRHDFFIEETYEAGLALVGTEVKALRAHKANLRDSYARVKDGELFLHGIHIGAYAPAGQFSHKETRPRKLLLHRRELDRIEARVQERGLTLVPTRIYFSGGHAKVEIALARGKDVYDKRHALKEKDSKRDIERGLREARR